MKVWGRSRWEGTGPARSTRSVRALAALTLSLGLGTALGACSGDSEPRDDTSPSASDPTGSPSSPRTPGTAPTPGTKVDVKDLPEETVRAVEKGGDAYFDGWTSALGAPDAIDPAKEPTVDGLSGAALEELLNTLAEYRENGWRMEGSPRVLSTRVLEVTEKPSTVRMVACVDNSDVRLVDDEGNEVPNSRQPNPRTRNVLTLVPEGGAWVVAAQRPATRPDC